MVVFVNGGGGFCGGLCKVSFLEWAVVIGGIVGSVVGVLGRIQVISRGVGRREGRGFRHNRGFGVFGSLNFVSSRIRLRSVFLTGLLGPGKDRKREKGFLRTFLGVLRGSFPTVSTSDLRLSATVTSMKMRGCVNERASDRNNEVSVCLASNGRDVVVRGGVGTNSRRRRVLEC